MTGRVVRQVWKPVMRSQHRLPCSGREEGPLWQSLCRQTICSPASLPHHSTGWIHTQAGALGGRPSIWGSDMCTTASRRFSMLTPAVPLRVSAAGSQPAAAGSLDHRQGSEMAQGWLQHGRWGMTGLRRMSSEHRTCESMSRHYGLKRSVRVAATGEAGFVKGAGVVFPESPGLKLQRRAFIVWDNGGPQSVFIVKKPHSLEASAKMKEIGDWLTSKGLKVLVERSVQAKEFPEFDCFDPLQNDVDFCVTLGGDGTVLHLASLFTEDAPLPPLASFAMGTLGFLTPFDAADFEACLQRVLSATELPVFCTLRTRKRCEMYRDGHLHAVHHVLNECLIDRGSSPSMVRLELYVDGHHITTVRADGLIIATPSGSTAYSLSAGGPMVAPSVPCALLTPIAPHSLSFRPLVVPEASDIEIHLPATSRSHARASFDGRNTQRMMAGSSIRCTTSLCALPVINLAPLDNDWYDGIVQKLKWNVSISPREMARLPSLKKPSHEDNNSAQPLSSF